MRLLRKRRLSWIWIGLSLVALLGVIAIERDRLFWLIARNADGELGEIRGMDAIAKSAIRRSASCKISR